MIKAQKIVKSFSNEDKILNDISFSINKGDSVAIIGQSGVGKSVLLKHLNGLLKPDSGEVFVDNILLNKISFNELLEVRRKMAMVFQFGALFDSLTIHDNIMIALDHLTNLSKIEKEEATKAELEQLKKGLMQVLLTGKVRVKA